ncbi:hypothetical protein Indivirus_1_168 [Indivirus ILV1]|uniref:Uncharacterized protein n=1 Tax=Indivirus ILV1 TaxID=1977633 RepID=A0A1V0SCW2_9VIRU|nr:hypothetical protein Indivirus_1_168 [Indivirus ILV1]
MAECGICLDIINKNTYYGKIDDPNEIGFYHLHCLQRWLESNNNGILTQNTVDAYHILLNDQIISTIKIEKNIQQPSAPLISNENEEYVNNNRYYYEDRRNNIIQISVCFLVIVIIIIMLILTFIYVTKQ